MGEGRGGGAGLGEGGETWPGHPPLPTVCSYHNLTEGVREGEGYQDFPPSNPWPVLAPRPRHRYQAVAEDLGGVGVLCPVPNVHVFFRGPDHG
eukprot:7750732-Pyramimonas_sp.AAC.1